LLGYDPVNFGRY